MDIFGHFPTESAEKLNVDGPGCKPFFAADNVSGLHKVVVNNVSKVIGRNTVGFKKNDILVVFRHIDFAFDKVVKVKIFFCVAFASETKDPCFAFGKGFFNFFKGHIAVSCPFSVIAGVCFFGFLLFSHFCKVFFGAEAGIGFSFRNKFFCKNVIKMCSLTLAIRTVIAFFAVDKCAFIKIKSEFFENVDNGFNAAFNSAFCVGIFNSEEENAAALVCKAFIGNCAEKVAEMHKTGGAWCNSGYLCAFGKISFGIACFNLFRGFGNIREQKFRKFLIIHFYFPPERE